MEAVAAEHFEAAIRDGILIDVSHLAVKIGLLCPTFITSAFWNSVEIDRSEERLVAVLDGCCSVHEMVGAGTFGKDRFGVGAGPPCPWGVGVTTLVEFFEGRGTVAVIGEVWEELDFSEPHSPTGGSFYTV